MSKLLFVLVNEKHGTAQINTTFQSKKKLKIEVKLRSLKINHDIQDKMITIPLTLGSGVYTFSLYEQKFGTTYRLIESTMRSIKLENNEIYRFYPNDYVPFTENSTFYQVAQLLRTSENIHKYIISHFRYDYIKALLSPKKSFTTPDLETCFKKQSGVCYDFAALEAAMMRICGIPAALAIGTANRANHAWVEVNGKIYDPAKSLTNPKVNTNYLVERYY